jgi:low affinity Fe/Cu permease
MSLHVRDPLIAQKPKSPSTRRWLVLILVGLGSYELATTFQDEITAATSTAVVTVLAVLLMQNSANTRRELISLRQTLLRTRRELDQLRDANTELQRSNAEIRAMDIAFRDLLNLADERSHGQMRALIATTGAALTQLLEEELACEPQPRKPLAVRSTRRS